MSLQRLPRPPLSAARFLLLLLTQLWGCINRVVVISLVVPTVFFFPLIVQSSVTRRVSGGVDLVSVMALNTGGNSLLAC